MNGFIKLFRMMLVWRWFRDPSVAHLFTYLLLRANYSDAEWKDITICRGQLITSRYTLSKETGLSEKVIRRCLKALVKTGEISIQTTSQYSLITVCKYTEYQGEGDVVDQEVASKGPAKGQRKAINKEREERNNGRSSLRSDSSSVLAPTISEDKIDHQAFMQFFNKEMAGKTIPKIVEMNKLRKGMLNARVKEYGKDAVAVVVRKAAASTWLNGGGGEFVASFDWLFKPKNFIKVYEGNYDDHHTNSAPISKQPSQGLVSTNSNISTIISTTNSFKFSSYEQHRKDEQQKRLQEYSEAVNEILERR